MLFYLFCVCVFCIRFYDFLFGCMFATISVCLSGGFGFGCVFCLVDLRLLLEFVVVGLFGY